MASFVSGIRLTRIANEQENTMNRRDFLHSAATVSLATLVGVGVPGLRAATAGESLSGNGGQVAPSGGRFKGTPYGRIFESLDGGKTWQLRADFGAHCAIPEVFESQGKIYARIMVQGYSFLIKSSDARFWYTTV